MARRESSEPRHAVYERATADDLGAWLAREPALLRRFVAHGADEDATLRAMQGAPESLRDQLAADPTVAKRTGPDGFLPLCAVAGSRLGVDDEVVRGALREAAALLLDAGAEVNATVRAWSQDVDAAYFAIRARHLAMLELLLARGADAERALASAVWVAPDPFGHCALRHGADADRATSNRRPLLHDLIRWGQIEAACWLLPHVRALDRVDGAGWTALHQAVSRGSERMVRALIERGATRDVRDRDGKTPLDFARTRRRSKLVAWLCDASR